MPIKNIQLRGISRTPSDRVVEDGGCAESLNMQVDFQELAPNTKPRDLTADPDCWEKYGLPPEGNFSYHIKFIHKGNNYRNFICADIFDKEIFVWGTNNDNFSVDLDEVSDASMLHDEASNIVDLVDQYLAEGQMTPQQKLNLRTLYLWHFEESKPVTLWGHFDSLADAQTKMQALQEAVVAEYGDTFTCQFSAYSWESFEQKTIVSLDEDEELKDITAIGNTLVISTTRNVYYALYKNGAYLFLGNDVPKVNIGFSTEKDTNTSRWTVTSEVFPIIPDANFEKQFSEIPTFLEAQQQLLANYGVNPSATQGVDKENDMLQSLMSNLLTLARNNDMFLSPVLLRFAVRLYDGTYKHISSPILVDANTFGLRNTTMSGRVAIVLDAAFITYQSITATLGVGYKILYDYSYNFENWKDIISSIDVFCCEPIYHPGINNQIKKAEYQSTSGSNDILRIYVEHEQDESIVALKDLILGRGPFFLVDSIQPDFSSQQSGSKQIKAISQDELFVKPQLKDGGEYASLMSFDKSYSFNGKLMLSGITEKFYPGYDKLSSEAESNTILAYFRSYFYIRTEDGSTKIVQGMNDYWKINTSIGKFIAYPNSRCFKAEVYRKADGSGTWYRKTYDMEPHPLWTNMAFAVEDESTGWENMGSSVDVTVDDMNVYDNKLIVSDTNNPFVFPLTSFFTFNTRILGFAAATIALSTGQFGQFPLYVFTAEGIEALTTGTDGSFVSHHPVTREVAIEGSITQIDQAIIFTTERSVMMLSGSEVTDIAPYMNGRHYILEPEVSSLLSQDIRWRDLVLNDTTPFMQFMREAVAIYDYKGKRLLFASKINSEISYYPYMYVYKLDSQTWHKVKVFGGEWDGSLHVRNVLNSYPEALAQVNNEYTYTRLYDFSNAIDIQDPARSKGLVATRIIDFEQPDTYKTINRLKIRGNFLPEFTEDSVQLKACQYILLASNDGVNFRVLHSLRGPSWKYFRIILLSELLPTDRISYLELEWEPRFNDRIR